MAVAIRGVRKTYFGPDGSTVPVVNVADLSLDDGQQVALIGSSGSGKTTFLHIIAGIVTADAGAVVFTLDGRSTDITRLSEGQRDVFRGRHIGYIFQTHHLLPGFTALENVLLGMSFTGRKHDTAWAKHLLEEVGLEERLHYLPAKLSVGQQQRVAVARALASRPSTVLADEPTGALDTANACNVLQLIRRLCAEVNAGLIVVTHDPEIARQFTTTLNLAHLNEEVSV